MRIDALLDRSVEVAAVDDLLATLRGGRGATILVEGVPGIGKTALLRYGREQATRVGVRVLEAGGSEMDRHLAFGGLRQLLFDVLRSGAELVGPAAAAAPALGLGEVAQPPDIAAVAQALRWVLGKLAAERPILFIIDDLHWIDPASQQVLALLLPRTDNSALGFLLASRPQTLDTVDFDQALRDAGSDQLHPAPLSAQAVGRLVANAVTGPVDAGFVAACIEVTGGVPFLVIELLREVRARQLRPDGESADIVRGLAPRSIQRNVLARLVRLPAPAQRFANAAAILPPGADAMLAAEVAGVADVDVAVAVRSLVSAGVLRDKPLDFLHPVMRAAVFEALTSVEVSETHRRAAAALRSRSAPAADIALHLLHTEPRGCAADAETLATAGAVAAAAGAPETAVEYLRRALDEPPELAARPGVVAALGRALAANGDDAAVSVLQSAYDAEPDPGTRAHVALYLAEALEGDEARSRDAVHLLQHAAQELAVDDDRRLALLARAVLYTSFSDLVDVYSWCMSEIPSGLAGDTPAQRACMVIKAYDSSPDEARRLLIAAATQPDFVSAELPGSVILSFAIMGLRAIGELHLALDLAQRAATRAEGWGRPTAVAHRLGQVAMMQWRLGHLAEARATADRATTFLDGRPAGPDRTWVEAARARVILACGAVDEAEQAAGQIPQSFDSNEFVQLTRAEIAAARGDLSRAADLFPRAHPDTTAVELPQFDSAAHRGAVWLAAAGRIDEAHEQLALLEVAVRRLGSADTHGRLLCARGVVERNVDLVRNGVTELASTQFRFHHTEALLELGMLLRRKGELKEARQVLRESLAEARAMDAGLLAQTAASELAVAGGRRISRASRGPASLTRSELRVAQRAAAGLTNAQIAEILFINVKTVEMHLANTYRKLGITRRAGLAQALEAETTAVDAGTCA